MIQTTKPEKTGAGSPRARATLESDAALALQALVWILGDAPRAERLLALTGLEPAELRMRAGDPAVLAAVLGFLAGHESDLIGCAAALDVPAATLMAAQARLEEAA